MSRKILMVTFIIILAGSALFLMGSPCEPEQKPDLVYSNPHGYGGACELDDEWCLVVYVKNQGTADAPASRTKVEITCETNQEQYFETPAIPTGQTVELLPHIYIPPECLETDFSSRITVDDRNEVAESDETNNTFICNIPR
jgi:subtilase family serine protease